MIVFQLTYVIILLLVAIQFNLFVASKISIDSNVHNHNRRNTNPHKNNKFKSTKITNPISITVKDEKMMMMKKKLFSDIFTSVDSNNNRVLTFYGLMLAGAVARSVSATAVHPLNVMKTMLQTRHGKMPEFKWHVLSRGAGSQFIMSVPHGALNFVVTETTKAEMTRLTKNTPLSRYLSKAFLNSVLDFLSSAISTFICSIVSTPQMVITDQIMAGVYRNFLHAITSIYSIEGIGGFYLGWLPALAQKIPSYSLTWMFFQQFKSAFSGFFGRAGTSLENTMLGSLAAAGACCVMMPLDTVKTRIVTQGSNKIYKGMWHCIIKILKDEGIFSFYKALPPRLLSVVPMIGIQFAVYELMKRLLLGLPPPKKLLQAKRRVEKLKGK